jgi:hypothetical protein
MNTANKRKAQIKKYAAINAATEKKDFAWNCGDIYLAAKTVNAYYSDASKNEIILIAETRNGKTLLIELGENHMMQAKRKMSVKEYNEQIAYDNNVQRDNLEILQAAFEAVGLSSSGAQKDEKRDEDEFDDNY